MEKQASCKAGQEVSRSRGMRKHLVSPRAPGEHSVPWLHAAGTAVALRGPEAPNHGGRATSCGTATAGGTPKHPRSLGAPQNILGPRGQGATPVPGGSAPLRSPSQILAKGAGSWGASARELLAVVKQTMRQTTQILPRLACGRLQFGFPRTEAARGMLPRRQAQPLIGERELKSSPCSLRWGIWQNKNKN